VACYDWDRKTLFCYRLKGSHANTIKIVDLHVVKALEDYLKERTERGIDSPYLFISQKMNEISQEHKEDPEPVVLDKNEVKTIFACSGVANDRMEFFDQCFDAMAGEDTSLMMTNVYNPRSFEVKTPDVVIKVNPERTDLVNTKLIDGRQCLVIELYGTVEVNGIAVNPM
jgi:hypothetical protein